MFKFVAFFCFVLLGFFLVFFESYNFGVIENYFTVIGLDKLIDLDKYCHILHSSHMK